MHLLQRRRVVAAALVVVLIGGAVFWLTRTPDISGRPELKPAVAASIPFKVQVGKNVHVSTPFPATDHMGCTLAADPSNPLRLFAASTLGDNYEDVAGYYSHDGGTTWQLGGKRPHKTDEHVADEDVTFGPNGTLFFMNMRVNKDVPGKHRYGTPDVGSIDLAVSADGGKTWEERASVSRYIDRPRLTVDRTSGPSRGRLYVQATVEEPIVLVSGDAGKSLADGGLLSPKVRSTRPSNPVVLANGTVLVADTVNVTGADTHQEIPLWRSVDGGKTFTLATPNLAGRWRHLRIKSRSTFDVFYPSLAVDPGTPTFAGRVYCVWRDGHTSDESYILFASSPDSGTTWTAPVVVSEQPAGANAAADYGTDIPAVAVNKDGVVAVAWYDRRGLPKHVVRPDGVIPPVPGYNIRLRVSCDGGATWQPSVSLNDVPMKGEQGEARYWIGLTSAADGRFHATWIGDATGKRQVWTATITVN